MDLVAAELALIVAAVFELNLSLSILASRKPLSFIVLAVSPAFRPSSFLLVVAPLPLIGESEVDVAALSLSAIAHKRALVVLMLVKGEQAMSPGEVVAPFALVATAVLPGEDSFAVALTP